MLSSRATTEESAKDTETESDNEYFGIETGSLLKGRFLVGDRIGSGGFGDIFKATDTLNNDQIVAVKVNRLEYQRPTLNTTEEKIAAGESENNEDICQFAGICHWDLHTEYNVMNHMESIVGFPKAYKLDRLKDESYLAMELLGPSLTTVFSDKNCTFSLNTLLIIMDQLLDRLEMLHSKGIIHGDFTPNNILLPSDLAACSGGDGCEVGVLYLIDFGLSTMFMDPKTGNHLPKRINRSGGGTPRFMSVGDHQAIQRSRRDDMESLANVMAHFTTHGQLPWDKFDGRREFREVEKMKRNVKGEELFDGMPREFALFFKKIRELKYEEQPDYTGYRAMFRRLGAALGVVYDEDKVAAGPKLVL